MHVEWSHRLWFTSNQPILWKYLLTSWEKLIIILNSFSRLTYYCFILVFQILSIFLHNQSYFFIISHIISHISSLSVIFLHYHSYYQLYFFITSHIISHISSLSVILSVIFLHYQSYFFIIVILSVIFPHYQSYYQSYLFIISHIISHIYSLSVILSVIFIHYQS